MSDDTLSIVLFFIVTLFVVYFITLQSFRRCAATHKVASLFSYLTHYVGYTQEVGNMSILVIPSLPISEHG